MHEKKSGSPIADMNDLLSRSDSRPLASAPLHPKRRPPVRLLVAFFSVLTGLAILFAFGSSAVLLLRDVPFPFLTQLAHAPISAIPLLLIGVACLCFQIVIRPKLLDLLKACLVSAAFLLWGIEQLLPVGWLATLLGDVVIVLYVLDLGWMMAERLRQQFWSFLLRQETQPLSVQPAPWMHLLPSPPVIHSSQPLVPTSASPRSQEEHLQETRSRHTPANAAFALKRHRLLPMRASEQTKATRPL